ncbi:hypothetical protein HPB52_024066 [Rhipicephalus sanguineus]|uniref:HTH psq-type domain-containing protein n=1 Tax=Rhipicephalus sanguineus TaxID=34632 RepID=A0A9D4T301_RHISA|nr:hypothetical protein HPB52_024066 [Rhipicephalus sanguineus]
MAESTPKKRKAILIGTKLDIVWDIQSGMKNVDVTKKYDLSKSTISTILKDEKKLHAVTNISGVRKQMETLA